LRGRGFDAAQAGGLQFLITVVTGSWLGNNRGTSNRKNQPKWSHSILNGFSLNAFRLKPLH
jgi:hypothetical protein